MSAPREPITVPFNDGLSYRFPTDLCCNCGREDNLAVRVQDTRLTRFLLFGGSEYTFSLPLTFCGACARSAARRPVTLLHGLLVLMLVFFLMLALVLVAGMALESAWLLEQGPMICGALAVVAVVAWYGSRRPRYPQSTFYQPVRVTGVKAKFVSGRTRGLRLAFTNASYRRKFELLNADEILAGQVEVRDA